MLEIYKNSCFFWQKRNIWVRMILALRHTLRCKIDCEVPNINLFRISYFYFRGSKTSEGIQSILFILNIFFSFSILNQNFNEQMLIDVEDDDDDDDDDNENEN